MDKEVITLQNIPIPPSSNHQYVLVNRGRKTYHVPSGELKAFRKKMETWHFAFCREMVIAKNKIHEWIAKGSHLSIHCSFSFEYSRVFLKSGAPRKMDVSNRLKSLHDELAKYLGVDDCYFFDIRARKGPSDTDKEFVTVEIEPFHANYLL